MIIEGIAAVAIVMSGPPAAVPVETPLDCTGDMCVYGEGNAFRTQAEASNMAGPNPEWSRWLDMPWEHCEIPVHINYTGGWGRDFTPEIQVVADIMDLDLVVQPTDWRASNEYERSPHYGITITWPTGWDNDQYGGMANADIRGGELYGVTLALRPGEYSAFAQSYLFHHELGHALGLGHAEHEYQVMNYSMKTDQFNWGDFDGIWEIQGGCLKN